MKLKIEFVIELENGILLADLEEKLKDCFDTSANCNYLELRTLEDVTKEA